MSGPIHFEIHVDDPERAMSFYAAVFGWTFQDWSDAIGGAPYWGIIAAPDGENGINGGLMPRSAPAPEAGHGAAAYVCTMLVDDFDTAHEKILAAGGRLALPKVALTGMAWQGYYLDPEGNTFGIHQPDPNAA